MMCRIISWYLFSPFVPTDYQWNLTAYLSTAADHVHPFMTIMCPSPDFCFQACLQVQIISNWFLEQLDPTVTRSISPTVYNHAASGYSVTEDSHHGCAANNITEKIKKRSKLYTQNSKVVKLVTSWRMAKITRKQVRTSGSDNYLQLKIMPKVFRCSLK